MFHPSSRIREADIDTVLECLLKAGGTASRAFLNAAIPDGRSHRIRRVARQTSHEGSSGTIDLDVLTDNGVRLLVENKIDAGWSVTRNGDWQADRYCRTVEALRVQGVAAISVLVAPAIYLSGSRHAELFDAQVSYEVIANATNGPDAEQLENAIRQAETPYEPVANAQTGDFFSAYADLVASEFSALTLKINPNGEGVRPTGSRTFYFDAKKMLRDHNHVPRPRISVQAWDSSAPTASAKFMIGGWGNLATKYPAPASLTEIGAYLRPAGRSLGLAIDTPRLDTQQAFGPQIESARRGLEAISALREWWNADGHEMVIWRERAENA